MRCISPVYLRSLEIAVPCGKCNFCLNVKRGDWSFRLHQEQKNSCSAFFLTMTYDDDHLVYNVDSRLPVLNVRDVQSFKKRLRKEQQFLSSERLRYYTVGEYGTLDNRPHYHSIMFNLHSDLLGFTPDLLKNNEKGIWSPELGRIWRGGIVHVGNVNDASINYVTKYVVNRHNEYAGREPPFAVMSRKPGLGANYIQTHKQWHLSGLKNYANVNGIKTRVPRYIKDKIFEPWDRQHLARIQIREQEIAYALEVKRLSALHPDPENYMVERERFAHEQIFKHLNDKNKF